jgi:hypothetical protein
MMRMRDWAIDWKILRQKFDQVDPKGDVPIQVQQCYGSASDLCCRMLVEFNDILEEINSRIQKEQGKVKATNHLPTFLTSAIVGFCTGLIVHAYYQYS